MSTVPCCVTILAIVSCWADEHIAQCYLINYSHLQELKQALHLMALHLYLYYSALK